MPRRRGVDRGIGPALFEGGAQTCAARVRAGEDTIDAGWSLSFSDVTEGRQAAALRLLGDGKALIAVFHDETAEISTQSDRFALVDAPSWRFWSLDLESLVAQPIDGIAANSGGYYSTQNAPAPRDTCERGAWASSCGCSPNR